MSSTQTADNITTVVPRIGITTVLTSDAVRDDPEVNRHVSALSDFKAQSVVLPKDLDPFGLIDRLGLTGLLFTGGGDLNALRYGGEPSLANDRVDDDRDAFELTLMQEALDAELPVLCVCRGLQVANVALGGTLIEDLPNYLGAAYSVRHHQRRDTGLDTSAYAHEVSVIQDTTLYEIVKSQRIMVNSFHHQAIGMSAPRLSVQARADDGVIEAVGLDRYPTFFLGLQWHPELLWERDQHSARIYERFVLECAN
jgi:putative glutamine amidotransferase